MCLTNVDKIEDRIGIGYKTCIVDTDGYSPYLYRHLYNYVSGIGRRITYKIDKWIRCGVNLQHRNLYKITADDGSRYITGIHVYKNIDDARKVFAIKRHMDVVVCILKVMYKSPHAQDPTSIVADAIKVIEEIERR